MTNIVAVPAAGAPLLPAGCSPYGHSTAIARMSEGIDVFGWLIGTALDLRRSAS